MWMRMGHGQFGGKSDGGQQSFRFGVRRERSISSFSLSTPPCRRALTDHKSIVFMLSSRLDGLLGDLSLVDDGKGSSGRSRIDCLILDFEGELLRKMLALHGRDRLR